MISEKTAQVLLELFARDYSCAVKRHDPDEMIYKARVDLMHAIVTNNDVDIFRVDWGYQAYTNEIPKAR
jgi:hypothetical protein